MIFIEDIKLYYLILLNYNYILFLMNINQIITRNRLWMARKVKSLVEAKPKITNLYDSFIGLDKEEKEHNLASSIDNEFFKENSALIRQNNQLEEQSEDIDFERQRFISTELLSDEFKPQMKTHTLKILKKLDKNTKWGFAGELIKQKNKDFARDRLPTTEELKEFLIREMFKDIQIFDLIQLNKNQLADVGILATGYSNRHVYKAAKTLSKEMEKLEEGILRNAPRVHGRKDDEWVMICIGSRFMIHLMTENAREDAAIEDKWLDQEICNSSTLNIDEIKKKVKEYENPFKFRNINK